MNYLDFGPIVEPRMSKMHGGRVRNSPLVNAQNNSYAVGGMVPRMQQAVGRGSFKPSPLSSMGRGAPSRGISSMARQSFSPSRGASVNPMVGLPSAPAPAASPYQSASAGVAEAAGPIQGGYMDSMNVSMPPPMPPMLNNGASMMHPPMGSYADGGPIGLEGPMSDSESVYIDMGTGAGGRADNIDANVSENEYIIDAETMALLGDGNPDEGARKMDEMREAIRRHKGAKLAEGAISDNALSALEYCDGGPTYAGGGKVMPRLKSFKNKAEGREKAKSMYDSGAIGTRDFERMMHEVEMSAAPDHEKGIMDAVRRMK